jgi:excisionase family DNA binding protein
MDDLLTTRQVLERLKVDRITVYRMLQDGRLKGVKIGQQWRFNQREVDRLLGVETAPAEPVQFSGEISFPTHCVQTIQDLFATVGQISAGVVDMEGKALTKVSRPCLYFQILQRSTSASKACHLSWQTIALESRAGSRIFTCYSGLQWLAAPVFDREEQVAVLLAGQFYWQPPDPQEEDTRVRRLAALHNLPLGALQQAAREIPLIAPEQHARVEAWPASAANAVQSILAERRSFIERLHRIADLTQVS